MGERRRRAIRLARGAVFARRHSQGRAPHLEVGRRVRVNRHHRDCTLDIGRAVRLGEGMRLYLEAPGARITIGGRTGINRRAEVMARTCVSIGRRCAISWDVQIVDSSFHSLDGQVNEGPVRIGDDVWIGAGAMVLPGVTIGDGAIVAARALVNKDVPPRTLVGGVPAVVLRKDVVWSWDRPPEN